MKIQPRSLLGILIPVAAICCLLGWYWHSANEASKRKAAEAEQATAYQESIKEMIRVLSTGADRLGVIKDPVGDRSVIRVTHEVVSRVEELSKRHQASDLVAAKRVELDSRYEAELNAAWDRWTRESYRIYQSREAAATKELEESRTKLDDLRKRQEELRKKLKAAEQGNE